MGKLYKYTLKVLFTKQVTFTIFYWSRHTKFWIVVESFMTLNPSGKSLDADSIHFKIWVCNKLYSCYFTFIKLIDVCSPTNNQCLIKKKSMKKAFMVFGLVTTLLIIIIISYHMHVLTIIITNFNSDFILVNTHSFTSLKSTDKELAWFNNVIIDNWYHKWEKWLGWRIPNICEIQLGSRYKVKVIA